MAAPKPDEFATASRAEIPEPNLTPREIIARAEALRGDLIERQAETERLTWYPEATHEAFLKAGFYRILQPRNLGGYEFDTPTFFKVVIELARGCPSTAWCYCLCAAHIMQITAMCPRIPTRTPALTKRLDEMLSLRVSKVLVA